MPDCASKAKISAVQHEGRVTVCVSPVQGTTQQISPPLEKITAVTVIAAKYDNYFDDPNYYSA